MIAAPLLRIVLATRPVDFRRGHDALAATAAGELDLDIYSGVIVIFRSRRGDRLKLLTWDGTGLVMTYKRLEQGRFAWPRIEDGVMRLTSGRCKFTNAHPFAGRRHHRVLCAALLRPAHEGAPKILQPDLTHLDWPKFWSI